MNLVTRKQFLVERKNILNQMKAKVAIAEADIRERSIIATKICKMTIANDKIEVPCSFLTNWGNAHLGSLKYS